MIVNRKNIDTDELVFWIDPDNPLSYIKSEAINSVAGLGKNLFTGTTDFYNTYPEVGTSYAWNRPGFSILGVSPVAAPAITDPDGSTNSRLLQEDTSNVHQLRFDLTVEGEILGPPETVTYSLFVKDGPSSNRQIRIFNTNTDPYNAIIKFDFATNTVSDLGDPGSNIGYGAIDVGGGWYRIWYSLKIENFISAGSYTIRTFIELLDASGNPTYTGDGSSGVYIYGPQFEEGALSNYVEKGDSIDYKNAFQNRKFYSSKTDPNPTPYTTSFEGTSLRFNAIDSGLASSPNVRLSFRDGASAVSPRDHSIFAWIKLNKIASGVGGAPSITLPGYAVFSRIGGRTNNGLFGIVEDGNKIMYKVRGRRTIGGDITYNHTSNIIPDLNNDWHLISVSWDSAGGTCYFYLDGNPVGSDFSGWSYLGVSGSGGGLEIGYSTSTDPNFPIYNKFSGLINTAGFYNKILNASEHEALYNATKYRFHN